MLQALITAGYSVAAVVVAQNEVGKSRRERPLEVAAIAEQHGIPVLAPTKLLEAKDQLASFGATAAILVAYGKIVPQEIIDIFPHGIINIHPSLLPLHRGPTPLESVILKGEPETGVSLMALGSTMDAGPVYAQETVLLRGDENKQSLADQLLNIGKDMVIHYLPSILDGSLRATPQDDSAATYDKLITKGAGQLDWNMPAEWLAREVRAYFGWPRSRATLGTQEVIVTRAHATEGQAVIGTLWLGDKQLGMHCGEGILVIDSLIPLGKKEMTAAAFLAGYTPEAPKS